jgi:hypothetical protein
MRSFEMPRIMTKCPTTERDVPTVYRMSQDQLDALEGEFAFRCPACEDIHRWRRADAWVEAGPAQGPAVAEISAPAAPG